MSETHVVCPGCQARFKVPAGFSKESVPCQKCGATIAIRDAGRGEARRAPVASSRKGSARSGVAAARARHARGGERHEKHAEEKKSKTGLVVALSAAGVAVVALVVFLVVQGGGDAEPAPPVTSPVAKSEPEPAAPSPEPEPIPAAPVPVQGSGDALIQEGDSLFAETPGKRKKYPVEKLPHLDDTTSDTQARIDSGIEKLVDVSNPRIGNDARRDLIGVGRPAIPRLLSAWVDLKMDDERDVMAGNMIHQTLSEITGKEMVYSPEQPTSPSDAKLREKVLASWFTWWGQNKDTFRSRSDSD